MAASKSRTYRAQIGERSFDVQLAGTELTVDNDGVDVAFERISDRFVALNVDGRSLPAVVEPLGHGQFRVTLAGREVDVRVKDEQALLLEKFGLADEANAAEREVHAPMPGLVLQVAVENGQEVAQGDSLLVLEAMKMENELRAPADGTIKTVHVAPGDAVGKNALLIEFE